MMYELVEVEESEVCYYQVAVRIGVKYFSQGQGGCVTDH